MSKFTDVRAFHQKFDLPVGSMPHFVAPHDLQRRLAFLQEELDEMKSSAGVYIHAEERGDKLTSEKYLELLAGVFDGLVDFAWVAMGTAVQMGLPFDEGWALVRQANMAKVRIPTDEGHKWGVGKPFGWQAPMMDQLIQHHTQRCIEIKLNGDGTLFCDHGSHKTEHCADCDIDSLMGKPVRSRGTAPNVQSLPSDGTLPMTVAEEEEIDDLFDRSGWPSAAEGTEE